MKLTGKALDIFYEWLNVHYLGRHDIGLHWAVCTDAMRWGVFQDFFLEHSIHIGRDDLESWWVYDMISGNTDYYNSRSECIKAANNQLNQQLKTQQ